jgi:hypothetical protein
MGLPGAAVDSPQGSLDCENERHLDGRLPQSLHALCASASILAEYILAAMERATYEIIDDPEPF